MSVTTTANAQTYSIRRTLADYDLHHSEEGPVDTSLNTHPSPSSSGNPPDWPTDHRRVPAYRPVNPELDQSQRRVFQNRIEQTFVYVMFTGVNFNARLSQLWRKTGGKLKNIQYQIGGEW